MKVWGTYNFNSGNEDEDIFSKLNNWGYSLQENGYGKEYYWEVEYTYEVSFSMGYCYCLKGVIMKKFIAKWPIYLFVIILCVVCIIGVFKPFHPISMCICSIYFSILIVIGTLSPIFLIFSISYAIVFISCICWCLCTSNVKKAFKLFMTLCAFDFLFHTIAISLAITFFDMNVINATVAKVIFLLMTVVWYKLKISGDAKLIEKLYSISSKRLYNCLKFTTMGVMLLKLIGTVIYLNILRFFMLPYTIISVTDSPFVSYENNMSGLQDIFVCFISIILIINLISAVLVLKKRKLEGLFLLTYLMISVSDFVCSHYINIYQKSIKTVSIILSLIFLIIGILAISVWKIELNKQKTNLE